MVLVQTIDDIHVTMMTIDEQIPRWLFTCVDVQEVTGEASPGLLLSGAKVSIKNKT